MNVNKSVIGDESENLDTESVTRQQTSGMVDDSCVFIATTDN